jgi:lipoprotein NlpD
MRRRLALLVLAIAGCAAPAPAPVEDRRAAAPPAPKADVKLAAAPAAPQGFYTVKRGDTLYSIALEHGADYREVAQWNALDDPSKINVGQVLRVTPPEKPAVEVGRPRIIGRVESKPLDGPAKPEARPEAKAEPRPPVVAAAPAALPAAGEFIWPVKGKVLAGFAEPRSKGIDIDGKPGDPVLAAAAGRVTYTGSGIAGMGKLVVIRHDSGFITVYAHNRDILVKEQQIVTRGQKIAELGQTDADRPKLHFQIRKGAAAVDPMRYLPAL